MKKEIRLYNVIFPIWLLWLVPQVWLIVLPGNLLIDMAVLLLALKVLKHRNKRAVVKQLWWKFWLFGFLADFIGVALLLCAIPAGEVASSTLGLDWLYDWIEPIMYNAFRSPLAFVWTLAAVGVAGYFIYRSDRRAMMRCGELNDAQRHKIALAMAVLTAPWLFFIPVY